MLTDDFFVGTKTYQKIFTDLCKPLVKYLGITHTIYVNIDKQGKIFSICSSHKWVERFLSEKYYLLDPLMVHPDNIHNGFSFDESSDYQEFKDTLLYDAVIKFDWCHSFAYIEKTNGGYFGFDFGTNKDNHQMINKLLNETKIVKKLIRNVHKNLLLETKDLQENKMDFALLKGDEFHKQKGLVFKEPDENHHKIQLLKDIGYNANIGDLINVCLSPQEINCLRLYLTNHSIKQVAKDLNLEITTVSSYVENVKDKLNCSNKNELFEKAEILESLGHI